MFAAFWASKYDLVIAAFILGAFAGLYTYTSLFGRRGGILRQLLVGITSATVFGGIGYVFNTLSHSLFSNTLGDLFNIPRLAFTSVTVALLFAVLAFAQSLFSPNNYRFPSQREHPRLPLVSFVINLLVSTFNITIYQVLAVQIIFFKWDFFPEVHPSLLYVMSACASVSLAISFIMMIMAGISAKANPGLAAGGYYGRTYIMLYLLSYTLPGWITLMYIISLVGWNVLVYLGISFIGIGLLAAVQYGADKLSQKQLQYISFVLFLMATALGAYVLVVFGA